jgi:transketolase
MSRKTLGPIGPKPLSAGQIAQSNWDKMLVPGTKNPIRNLRPSGTHSKNHHHEEGWETKLPVFKAGDSSSDATSLRKSYQRIWLRPFPLWWEDPLIWLRPTTPTSMGGKTSPQQKRAERNIHFGIREHAMGAVLKRDVPFRTRIIPFGATFLTFADYMRPSHASGGPDETGGDLHIHS